MIKKAFTLIEFLVAMGVASMVFLLTSSVLMTIISANAKSAKNEAFEQAKNDLGAELTGVIKWASEVNLVNDDILVDGNLYHYESGRIYKNDVAITPGNVLINDFEVENYSTDPNLKSLAIFIQMTHKADILASDTLKIVVSQRKLEVSHD
jgi:prepilin-type N-terminal cleavage/methylation domain-containing protein